MSMKNESEESMATNGLEREQSESEIWIENGTAVRWNREEQSGTRMNLKKEREYEAKGDEIL